MARPIEFRGSPRPTLGVEWEFALVDAQTRDLTNAASAVLAAIGETPHVHKELLRNTIEVVTGICGTVGEAMHDLQTTLATVRPIVQSMGMELFCAGTHPFARWSAQQLTGASGPDDTTKSTGDAGKRVACGLIDAG
ncbi:Possible carboxylate-amine ligase [Mycobacteroides abscessus subsp. abscessus]|nr:Possible carboxylate-amine ligase [Mycobacteroides abscessus subsp. abscessus]